MPFYNWDEMTKKNLVAATDSIASIIIGENITLNRSVNQPGDEARPHTHGCEQLINVVSGTAWFRVGDEEKTVTVGDIVHIPAGTLHHFKNKGDEEFVYLSFKNISEDWPPKSILEDKELNQSKLNK
ncbi:MAG: cupin domain-containing protein [Rhodospirillaceae bacterium]|jgi:quercetin dioxygenase-like cupin family protein